MLARGGQQRFVRPGRRIDADPKRMRAEIPDEGGQPADVVFASLLPGAVGLYQVGLTVPAGLAPGDQPVLVTQSGVAANTAVVAVQ